MKARRYYFRTYENSEIRSVDLMKMPLNARAITISMKGLEIIKSLPLVLTQKESCNQLLGHAMVPRTAPYVSPDSAVVGRLLAGGAFQSVVRRAGGDDGCSGDEEFSTIA